MTDLSSFSGPPLSWGMLDRYLAGECTPEEALQVRQVIAAVPDRARLLAELRERVRPETTGRFDVLAGLAELRQTVRDEETKARRTQQLTTARRIPAAPWLGRTIASLAAVATIAVVAWFGLTQISPTSVPAVRTYATAPGQQARITLDDGSRVTLGPATTLSISTNPSGKVPRTVTVTGQAFFTVQHSARNPFVVRTAYSTTNVLGTTFLVRQYATDRTARIVVTEGRVSVQGAGQTSPTQDRSLRLRNGHTATVLTARAMSVVDDSGNVIVLPNSGIDDYTAWTTGNLVFRDTPVHEVLDEISRFYGVRLRLADTALSSHVITWTVATSRSIESVLDGLTTLLESHMVRTDSVITIMPGPAIRGRPRLPNHTFIPEKQYGR